MSDQLKKYDEYLSDDGQAALVIREYLMPVEGHEGVVFPPTFAASEDKTFKGGYNVDAFPDGTNICLIDTVGSQANRIEPLFAKDRYKGLVPQISIKAGEKTINLLEAGHRAGDAIVRCSALQEDLRLAFRAVLAGDSTPLAKIAPTSLVFGVWDSRDTQAKMPRLISSTIRAFDVRVLTRSAQYVPATSYVADALLEEPTDKKVADAYAERGFIHVPASGSHGGVIASGGIRRDAVLHLAALRLLATGTNEDTQALQRYILGLSLTALTSTPSRYLRQGCNLVRDPEKPLVFEAVDANGKRVAVNISHDDAVAYAVAVAKAFGVGSDRAVEFDRERAKTDLSGGDKPAKKSKKVK
jgi:CRISPR-associated protein Csb1